MKNSLIVFTEKGVEREEGVEMTILTSVTNVSSNYNQTL